MELFLAFKKWWNGENRRRGQALQAFTVSEIIFRTESSVVSGKMLVAKYNLEL